MKIERLRGAVAVLIILLVCGITAVLVSGRWHPSDREYPKQGIDVSHHQGAIDWAVLPAQGVDFSYIKATEGGDHRDRRFRENWLGAERAGIARGAYHFFTLCRSGADQAANFIATVPREPMALPPAVDLEFLGNCKTRPEVRDFDRQLSIFIKLIEAHYGQRALLYLTKDFDAAYQVSAKFDRPLWLRNLIFRPDWGARPWAYWQLSNFRHIDGIDGRVDWNVARP